MNKTLRTTLVLAILISAAANAPGLLLALGNSQGADPAEGSSVAPVDYYAYDYDYDTTPAFADPGAWLDSLFGAADAPVASWRHTWTDFESAPTVDALNPYRRPVHWEPEGVLLAYVSTFSDIGYSDMSAETGNFSSRSAGRVTSALFGGFADSKKEGQGAEVPPEDEPPVDEPGPGPGPSVPDNDPPPDVTPPPPVSVPEPAPMGLLALGLAGLFMFGKRRRQVALAQDRRDRT